MRNVAQNRHTAHVVIHGPGHDGTTQVLGEGITTFGRLPSNDVILLGDLVSRHHARITYFERRATLQDLGSHNGCFVNGERVTTRVLKEGDKARVGNFQLVFFEGPPPVGSNVQSAATGTAPAPRLPSGLGATHGGPPASTSELLEALRGARGGRDPSARALRFVLRAADALAAARDLPAYMDEMLALAVEQTDAQVGAYASAGPDGAPQIVVARTAQGPVERPPVSMPVVRWAIDKAFAVKSEDLNEDIRFADSPSRVEGALAVLCVPVGVEEGETAVGAIYLSRPSPPFTEVELDAVSAVAHLVRTGLTRWASGPRPGGASLSRLFTEGAVGQLEARIESSAGGLQPVEGTVLSAGLLGAGAAASGSRSPAEHTHFYDAWCEAAFSVLAPAGAELSFGPGARVTGLFGPGPEPPGRRALEAALRLRETTDALVARHPQLAGARLRAGLDHGRVLVGAVGGPSHLSWLPLGEPVEIAARLETAAPGGAILITETLRGLAQEQHRLRPRGEQKVRGRAAPILIHEIVG